MNRRSKEGSQRAARVLGGLLMLCAVAGALVLSAPSATATDRAGAAHAGHARGHTVPLNRLERLARQRWPRTFAGLWQARGKAFVAFTGKAKLRTRRLRRRSVRPGRLRAVKFERSLRQLENAQAQMIADREKPSFGIFALPDYDLDIDITKNAPVATFETVTPALVSAMKAHYGQHLIVKQGPLGAFDACTRESCGPNLRSGLRTLVLGPDGNWFKCSTAFAVQQRSVAYRGILSAAHCGGPTAPDEGALRYHGPSLSGKPPPPAYGTVDRDRLMGRTDAEVHKITNPSFTRRPWIFDSSGLRARPVQRVSSWNWVRPGMGMCKAGATTGKTCGKVKSRYFSPGIIPGSERFIKTGYCARGGDSGAGVYLPHKLGTGETRVTAYGIHSGGAKGFDCIPGQPLAEGDFSFFGHIQYAQTALGVRVQLTK